MKYCLICFEDVYQKPSILHYFAYKDMICEECRSNMIPCEKWYLLDDLKIYCLYEYDAFMESLLFQFKEGKDIALKDLFLHCYIKFINATFKDYTLVFMPSSIFHTKERGFFALKEMFEKVDLKKEEWFIKKGEYKQSSKSYEQRNAIKKQIRLIKEEDFPTKVLLVDDVITSGNTLLSAYQLLKEKGVHAEALVLCNNMSNVELCDEKKFSFDFFNDILKKEVRRCSLWKEREHNALNKVFAKMKK